MFFVVFCLSKSMKVSDHPPFVGFFSTLRLIKTAKRKKDYIFSSEIRMFGSSIKNEICKRCFCPVLNFKILESLWNAHYEMWTYPIKLTRNVYIVHRTKFIQMRFAWSNSYILVRICLPKAVGSLVYYYYMYIEIYQLIHHIISA